MGDKTRRNSAVVKRLMDDLLRHGSLVLPETLHYTLRGVLPLLLPAKARDITLHFAGWGGGGGGGLHFLLPVKVRDTTLHFAIVFFFFLPGSLLLLLLV